MLLMEFFLEKEEEEGAIPSEGQEVPLASHFLTLRQTVISPQKNTFFGWHLAKKEKDENGQKITRFFKRGR